MISTYLSIFLYAINKQLIHNNLHDYLVNSINRNNVSGILTEYFMRGPMRLFWYIRILLLNLGLMFYVQIQKYPKPRECT